MTFVYVVIGIAGAIGALIACDDLKGAYPKKPESSPADEAVDKG